MSDSGKSGLSPLAWVGIGCGGLAVLGIIGMVILFFAGGLWVSDKVEKFSAQVSDPVGAAEFALDMHPDLEHVSTNREAGTMVV